jgi:hypothetical protein
MNELASKIRDYFKSNLKICYETVRKDEIYIRCTYCGDSQSNPHGAHLYIGLKEPYQFHCKKCETSGMVDFNFLKDNDVFDLDLIKEIVNFNKNYKRNNPLKTLNVKYKSLKYKVPALSGTTSELDKLKYINKRLKLNLTLKDIPKFKIILNLKKFFEYNKIDTSSKPAYEKKLLVTLHKYYIGFLSADNTFINFRRQNKDENLMRYRIYPIKNIENSNRFYIKPVNIDLMDQSHQVVITEGIFDLLSVYHNYIHEYDPLKTIFVAANGKGFYRVIKYLHRIGLINLDIHIYSDKDVNIKFYKKIKSTDLLLRKSKIKIFYNNKPAEKDFGVPLKKIERIYNIV